MPYVDLAGLSRFAGKSKDFASSECAELDMANWQKTSVAGAVSFSPVPEMPLDPVVNFLFAESGPASGTKGPDNPSTITGVNSVKVTRCGKNLLSQNYYDQSGKETYDVTFTVNSDKSVSCSGTASNYAGFAFARNMFLPAGEYFLTGCPSGGSNSKYSLAIQRRGGSTASDYGDGVSLVVSNPGYYDIYASVKPGYNATGLVFNPPQLELGSAATAFEPYEGADYTVNLGDTYYGGTLDVSSGTMTVTKEYITISSVQAFDSIQNGTAICRFWTGSDYPVVVSDGTETCDKLPYARSGSGVDRFFVGTTQNTSGQYPIYIILKTSYLDFSGAADPANPTSAEVKAAVNTYLASNPLHVVATRKEPATIQLTPQQILSLSQPDPYTPRINTVYSDQQSVQVGYPKSPQATASELTNAVISLGGNV